MDLNSELSGITRKHWSLSEIKKMYDIRPISTMSTSRIKNIMSAIEHIETKNIPGDVVECGVYMGGNISLCVNELYEKNSNKLFYAFDTFKGVPKKEITNIDTIISTNGIKTNESVIKYYDENEKWCYCDLNTVKENIQTTLKKLNNNNENYLNIKFIEGSVLDTIPKNLPDKISFILLDMDISKPTEHVLPYIWERMSIGGILQIDDYNSFNGIKNVINEFFSDKFVYIQEIDYTAISIVKIR